MRNTNFLNDLTPSVGEAVFALIFAGFVSMVIIAGADLQIHDHYILPLHGCHPDSPDNDSQICQDIREKNGCGPDEPTRCIGQNFWIVLPTMSLLFAIGVGIARVVIGKLAGAKVNGMLFLIGGLWFLTAYILPFTGWADATYYWLQSEDIPEDLPWLNDFGVLNIINVGDDPNNVEREDLYFVMAIGLLGTIALWGIATHLHKRNILRILR